MFLLLFCFVVFGVGVDKRNFFGGSLQGGFAQGTIQAKSTTVVGDVAMS